MKKAKNEAAPPPARSDDAQHILETTAEAASAAGSEGTRASHLIAAESSNRGAGSAMPEADGTGNGRAVAANDLVATGARAASKGAAEPRVGDVRAGFDEQFLRGECIASPTPAEVQRGFDLPRVFIRAWILRNDDLDPAVVDDLLDRARDGHARAQLPEFLRLGLYAPWSTNTIVGRKLIDALRRRYSRLSGREEYEADCQTDTDRLASPEERADLHLRAAAILGRALDRVAHPGLRALIEARLGPLCGRDGRTDASIISEFRVDRTTFAHWNTRVLELIREIAGELEAEDDE